MRFVLFLCWYFDYKLILSLWLLVACGLSCLHNYCAIPFDSLYPSSLLALITTWALVAAVHVLFASPLLLLLCLSLWNKLLYTCAVVLLCFVVLFFSPLLLCQALHVRVSTSLYTVTCTVHVYTERTHCNVWRASCFFQFSSDSFSLILKCCCCLDAAVEAVLP